MRGRLHHGAHSVGRGNAEPFTMKAVFAQRFVREPLYSVRITIYGYGIGQRKNDWRPYLKVGKSLPWIGGDPDFYLLWSGRNDINPAITLIPINVRLNLFGLDPWYFEYSVLASCRSERCDLALS